MNEKEAEDVPFLFENDANLKCKLLRFKEANIFEI